MEITQTAHKAVAAALVTVLFWVVHGITTGDWTMSDTLSAAATTIINGLLVYFVPNRVTVKRTHTEEGNY